MGISHENYTRGEIVNKKYNSASLLENVIPALKIIHDEGVAHNDMQEGNILIGPKEQTKLIDFGNAQTKEDGVGVGAGNDLPLKQVADLYSTLNLAYHMAVNETNAAHGGVLGDNYTPSVSIFKDNALSLPSIAQPMVQTFTLDDGSLSRIQPDVPQIMQEYAETLSNTINNKNLLKQDAVLPPIYNIIAKILKKHTYKTKPQDIYPVLTKAIKEGHHRSKSH